MIGIRAKKTTAWRVKNFETGGSSGPTGTLPKVIPYALAREPSRATGNRERFADWEKTTLALRCFIYSFNDTPILGESNE
jgi:hypothetical protein